MDFVLNHASEILFFGLIFFITAGPALKSIFSRPANIEPAQLFEGYVEVLRYKKRLGKIS